MKKIFLPFVLAGITGHATAQLRDSLDFKIGQMVLMGIPRADVDTLVFEAVKSGRVGGIILFEKNIPKKASAFADLKKIIWSYQKVAPAPLFVAIDQEGGRVNRLKEKYGFTRSITAEATGKAKSLDSARFYGEATAATLAGLGFNVNFAPCVDVAVEPTNPVIVKSGRSYSANEDSVTFWAREFIEQHRKFDVVTVLKHFPGHGSSTTDSHFGVADVTRTWTQRELKPYQALLQSGHVDAIMSCHIVNKALDTAGFPGTLSRQILGGMLRQRLNYNGVVFSDDMQMEAITKQYGFEESIKLAILAGVDVLCFANNVPGSLKQKPGWIFSVIRDAVLKGEIPRERIDQSYQRIRKLKSSMNDLAGEQYRQLWIKAMNDNIALRQQLEEARRPEPTTKKKKKKSPKS
ncbi:MAG: glycoside hydrolase family 3 protein [Cyclobacteriaceae bacterium]|jgi:beta-N-acetylhexosaminidase